MGKTTIWTMLCLHSLNLFKFASLLNRYDLLVPAGIKWLTQICVKSITVYKHLKKNYYE